MTFTNKVATLKFSDENIKFKTATFMKWIINAEEM